MNLNYDNYKDKVKACWIGKNIGGTMGTPYEGTHDILDIQGFVTKPGEVLPNDDLDLQLIWLYALEKIGPKAITAEVLGEYWISLITPHWNEYGIGKRNMIRGLYPSISGDYENDWKDSNGAWIRTEIWACISPGMPEIATRYAIEDAKVDHGAGEGTYAAAFVAAMQSAAFVLSDIRKCIDIGLSTIPENCRVAQSIRFVLEAYQQGKTLLETRNAIVEMNKDIGDGWFEAPSNVAYTVLGLIWGEGDFKKSMIYAINCGDDTDCTAATVGATLGIMRGMSGIPTDWMEYLGDDIITVSIAKGNEARFLPKTCSELTERVVKLAPAALLVNQAAMTLKETESDDIPEDVAERMLTVIREDFNLQIVLKGLKPYTAHFECPMFQAYVTLPDSPKIAPSGECKVNIQFFNNWFKLENSPYNLSMRWIMPEGFSVVSGDYTAQIPHRTPHTLDFCSEAEFVIKSSEMIQPVNKLILEVTAEGRPTIMYIPITLLG